MRSLREEMESLSSERARRIKAVDIALNRCPEGQLMHSKINGKYGYYQVTRSDGRKIRKVITRDTETINGLLLRDLLENERQLLCTELQFLNELEHKIPADSRQESVRVMLDKHREIPADKIIRLQSEQFSVSDWASEPYEHYERFPEKKIHMTSRGLMVRSKSEVIIAEALYAAGLPFRYEQVLHIGDVSYAPDFTILRADGKVIYWEHKGRMFDPRYFNNHFNTLRAYFSEGIVPWDNLILTYDSYDGCVDLREVKLQIELKLLV